MAAIEIAGLKADCQFWGLSSAARLTVERLIAW